ncbi:MULTISPECIES: alpha/beta hydrolase [Bacteria]|uniref:alpha/beta hydrolase n=1 Tax=Bacteria TaxID=2 RepID=UPI003C7B910A
MDPLAEALAREELTDEAREKLRGLERTLADDPQARLLSLFFHGAGPRAVVSFGDVDHADLVAVVMHGINTDLSLFPRWAGIARRLCADVIRAVAGRGGRATIATVAWFGYDSGGDQSARATVHATIGAARLSLDLDAIARRAPSARIAVLAYSYSSTLFGELVALGGAGSVSAAFSIGAAGMTRIAAGAVEDLIAQGRLSFAATESAADGIAPLGRLGQHPVDPRDIDGAIVYGSDGGPVDGLDGVRGLATDGHTSQTYVDEHGVTRRGYFDPEAQAYLFVVARLADLATGSGR